MSGIDRLGANIQAHPAAAAITAVVALVGVVVLVVGSIRGVRVGRQRGMTAEQAGTLVAAALATGVSAQGMWVFFGASLHLPLSLRIMFFAFLEIMVVTSALRARAAQQHGGSAGVDGIAMWVLTCLSAVLAATDAGNVGTVLIRLSAPLVAAWGWERSMALERRKRGNLGGINWRITPERILIRLGLADPTDRTASEAAAQRRLIDVALTADRARALRETGAGTKRINRATRRLRTAMRRAVEDGGLVDNSRDPRAVLLDNIRILSSATALLELELANPWTEQAGGAEPTRESESRAAISAATPIIGTQASNNGHVHAGDGVHGDPLANNGAQAMGNGAAGHRETVVGAAPWVPSEAPPQGVTPPAALGSEAMTDTVVFEPLRPDSAALSGNGSHAEPAPPRPPRRDPTVRARVGELHAAQLPTTEIAAQLGVSPRTVGRILADIEADSVPPHGKAAGNPAKTAVSSWHNGFQMRNGDPVLAELAAGESPNGDHPHNGRARHSSQH